MRDPVLGTKNPARLGGKEPPILGGIEGALTHLAQQGELASISDRDQVVRAVLDEFHDKVNRVLTCVGRLDNELDFAVRDAAALETKKQVEKFLDGQYFRRTPILKALQGEDFGCAPLPEDAALQLKEILNELHVRLARVIRAGYGIIGEVSQSTSPPPPAPAPDAALLITPDAAISSAIQMASIVVLGGKGNPTLDPAARHDATLSRDWRLIAEYSDQTATRKHEYPRFLNEPLYLALMKAAVEAGGPENLQFVRGFACLTVSDATPVLTWPQRLAIKLGGKPPAPTHAVATLIFFFPKQLDECGSHVRAYDPKRRHMAQLTMVVGKELLADLERAFEDPRPLAEQSKNREPGEMKLFHGALLALLDNAPLYPSGTGVIVTLLQQGVFAPLGAKLSGLPTTTPWNDLPFMAKQRAVSLFTPFLVKDQKDLPPGIRAFMTQNQAENAESRAVA